MPQNFLACDRDQELLLPPSLRDWLPEDHLAWCVLDAVEQMDLSDFYADYRADGHGRAAHDPAMMVALFAYAYAVGVRSSRAIERRLAEDVAFRVIAANQRPDHATVARFRVRHEQALSALFSQVLCLCARAGLVSVGVISLDGTKVRASAAERARLTYEQIAAEVMAEAAAIDAAEDERFGECRGDELAPELSDRRSRRARLAAAKRELEAEREERPAPSRARRPRLLEAKRRLEEEWELERRADAEHEAWRAAREAEEAARGRRMTRRRGTESAPEAPAGQVNVTDPDARSVKGAHGFFTGYNAQAVATTEQVILAADVTFSSSERRLLEPMVASARRELESAGIGEAPGTVLADAGYFNGSQIEALRDEGIEVLVAPDAASRAGPPAPNRRSIVAAQMRRELTSDRGRELYRRRQSSIEPVFAQIKVTRGVERFGRRGRAACRSEWRLIAATHNLLKLWRAGGLAPA